MLMNGKLGSEINQIIFRKDMEIFEDIDSFILCSHAVGRKQEGWRDANLPVLRRVTEPVAPSCYSQPKPLQVR